MFHNRPVNVHNFGMVPRAEIPRSSFRMPRSLKTTINASDLVPIFCEEVLPGDSWKVRGTCFGRLATPVFPVLDNLHLETFFFFVPCRLVWSDWVRFMGEQVSTPGDSISYSVPKIVGFAGAGLGTLADYFGIPLNGQVTGALSVNALPFRCYNLIWNQWFRDENLDNAAVFGAGGTATSFDDGPDPLGQYAVLQRRKRTDYFTGCLPWPQKGGVAVSLPLGTSATVKLSATELNTGGAPASMIWRNITSGTNIPATAAVIATAGGPPPGTFTTTAPAPTISSQIYPTNMYADLSTATAATINQLRQAFQIQKLLERDGRGGTRYIEIIRSHFGVISPDARLQRPEYLGGGHQLVTLHPVAQTSATGLTGGTSPQGNLAAMGTVLAHNHGFSQAFTEHGYLIGLVSVRADQTYSQGLRRMWTRTTRYDFYFPAFAMLGEQSVFNYEIYATGLAADGNTFGYQERWAEYRYLPSQIVGVFRPNATGTLDAWHYSQSFGALPALNSTFIQDPTSATLVRNLAAGSNANGQQLILDFMFDCVAVRPLPAYSVPGLIDHF